MPLYYWIRRFFSVNLAAQYLNFKISHVKFPVKLSIKEHFIYYNEHFGVYLIKIV